MNGVSTVWVGFHVWATRPFTYGRAARYRVQLLPPRQLSFVDAYVFACQFAACLTSVHYELGS